MEALLDGSGQSRSSKFAVVVPHEGCRARQLACICFSLPLVADGYDAAEQDTGLAACDHSSDDVEPAHLWWI